MDLRRVISFWALFALMLAQVALAQHSASHFDHSTSIVIEVSHNDYGHDHRHEDNKQHECPECLLTQSLQVAFYNIPDIILPISNIGKLELSENYLFVSETSYNLNFPRAPPIILI